MRTIAKNQRICFNAFALCALLLAPVAFGQEESVKPGINDSFKDPKVETYVNMFEGESRVIYKNREAIVDALDLEKGMDVADIGAGTGFFSRMMAESVGRRGKVYAVDIAQNFIDHIDDKSDEQGIKNIDAILCTERSVELAENSVDVVFICDVYHHFEYPNDTLASIHKAVRDGGRVFIVDFERVVGVHREWVLNHVRCGKGVVSDELRDAGFDFIEEIDLGMEEQYVISFRKRG